MYINEQTFRAWWSLFHTEYPLTEIRLLGRVGKTKKSVSGYFTSCNKALEAIRNYPDELGAYAPLNAIKSSCYGRGQHDVLVDAPETTTSDSDIDGRLWIMIDFDPKRSSGCNSTEDEKTEARKVMAKVGCFLRDNGFKSPIIADSCNGYHLYYRINLKNDKSSTELIRNFLMVLDMNFSNDFCEIDTTVHNASRIAKIISTRSVKGADTDDRPRRESKFIKIPEEIETTDRGFIEKIAAMMPEKEKPTMYNGWQESFNIEDFIQRNGIKIAKRSQFSSGQKLLLEECPFNSNHKAPDAAIFVMNNGALGFKCLHNSCSAYTWKDFRLHYEPDAYSQRDRDEFNRKRDYYSTESRPAPVIIKEDELKGKIWQSMRDIIWQDPSLLTYIPTGFNEIDRRMGGLALGDVTILSGIAGAGKTSIINIIALNAIQHGYKVALWSGELSPSRFKSWFNQAAAGSSFVRKGVGESEYYYCPKDISDKIDIWTENKVFLYNNNYGNKISQIMTDIRKCVNDNGTQLIIVDNRMALNLDAYNGEKNEKEASLINELKDFAMQSNIHILLVCHPRKEAQNSLLRMESIAGNSDLYNAASNVLLCHRVGRDFERRATDFFGAGMVNEILTNEFDEVVEIAKNRSHGSKDIVCGLYFDYPTRRFLNSKTEHIVYGWQEKVTTQELPIDKMLPDDLTDIEGDLPL